MKKKLSLVLALALALSLAACSSRTNSPASNTPPSVTSPDTPSTGSTADPEPSNTTGPAGDSPVAVGDGSGLSRTISTIAGLQPNATVLTDGLSVSRNSVPNAAQETMDWALEMLP